jgi:hypothetical protein
MVFGMNWARPDCKAKRLFARYRAADDAIK